MKKSLHKKPTRSRLQPGDMLVVVRDEAMWHNVMTFFTGGYFKDGYTWVKVNDIVTLIARQPEQEYSWAPVPTRRNRRNRYWGNELLFVMTSRGKLGYLIRSVVKRQAGVERED